MKEGIWDRTPEHALVGKLIEGRYRVDRKVGEGGFGVVFEGLHMALGVPIAIKVLRYPDECSASDRASLLGQFLAEAQLLPRLRHPNIVSALDVGTLSLEEEETARAFLVLEWCGSETLKKDLKARRGKGGRSVDAAWKVARPILDAIAHAHTRGFVHRDIKPANVMLVSTEHGMSPRVIDFGIAKASSPNETAGSGATQTHSKNRAFSLPYAAPEQIAGSRTGPWTDVHALGLILTELLVDQSPYGSDDVAIAVIDPNRPTPKTFGVDVGPWEPVLAKALSLRPAERYKDAGAFLEALENALNGARDAYGKSPPPPPANQAVAVADSAPPNRGGTAVSALANSASVGKAQAKTPSPEAAKSITTTAVTTGSVSDPTLAPPESALKEMTLSHSMREPAQRSRRGPIAIAVGVVAVGALGFTVWRFQGKAPEGPPTVAALPVATSATEVGSTAAATAPATHAPEVSAATNEPTAEPVASLSASGSSTTQRKPFGGKLPTAAGTAAPPPATAATAITTAKKETLY